MLPIIMKWFTDTFQRIWYFSQEKAKWLLIGSTITVASLGIVLAPSEQVEPIDTAQQQAVIYQEPTEKVIQSVKVSGGLWDSKSYAIKLTGNEVGFDIQTEKLENGNILIKVISPELNDFDISRVDGADKLIEKDSVFNARKASLESETAVDMETGAKTIGKKYDFVSAKRKEMIIYDKLPVALKNENVEIVKKEIDKRVVYEFAVNPQWDTTFRFGMESGAGTLQDNLLAYYKLSDVNDSVNGFNLTNNNTVAFNAGKIGNAADSGADNSNKSLSVASDLGIQGGNISISVWANVTTAPAANTTKVIAIQSDEGIDVQYEIRYRDVSGQKRLTFNRKQENVANNFIDEVVTLTEGTWYHIVLTYLWQLFQRFNR